MVIKLNQVSHLYSNGFVEERALDNISVEFCKSKSYCIVGPSGSGKSTLLNVIGGLLKPTVGKVYIDKQDITSYSEKELAELRLNKIGYIFQNFNLIPFLNVRENILLQLRIAKKDMRTYMRNYNNLISQLNIAEKEDSYINELSGGQQQRVAIARCLIMKPKIILADEPTGSLDSENTGKFIELTQNILREMETTFIIVTHNEQLTRHCDHTIRIIDGKIAMQS